MNDPEVIQSVLLFAAEGPDQLKVEIGARGEGRSRRFWYRTERPSGSMGPWAPYDITDEIAELVRLHQENERLTCANMELGDQIQALKEENQQLLALNNAATDRTMDLEWELSNKAKPGQAEDATIPTVLWDARQVPVPEGLRHVFEDYEERTSFTMDWSRYLEWRRREHKGWSIKKPWAERLLRELASWGPEKAVEALRRAVLNDYQGVFHPGGKGGQQPAQQGRAIYQPIKEG